MGTVTAYNLANVQAALGGANPISMSEYYRGGPYVPTTGTTTVSEGPLFQQNVYEWMQSSGSFLYIYWAGNLVYSTASYSGATSIAVGSTTYFRGAFVSSFFGSNRYYVSRQYPSTISINTGVPGSGTISLSQLLGARNP
jgi:hypothetical protein